MPRLWERLRLPGEAWAALREKPGIRDQSTVRLQRSRAMPLGHLFSPPTVVISEQLHLDVLMVEPTPDFEVGVELAKVWSRQGPVFEILPHLAVEPFEVSHQGGHVEKCAGIPMGLQPFPKGLQQTRIPSESHGAFDEGVGSLADHLRRSRRPHKAAAHPGSKGAAA